MTPIRAISLIAMVLALAGMSACGKDKILTTCDEPQAYQSIVASERVEVPEGLDPLDDFREMPIPTAETPPRPEGARCITTPPSVL